MAGLVAAFGSSHSPALASAAADMPGHARRDEQHAHHLDREGNRVTYQELLRKAPPGFDMSAETIERRVEACERHLDRLARSIANAKLDALIVVGDDQREQYFEDNMPAFLVYCGASIRNSTLDLPLEAPEYWKRARSQYHEPDAPRDYPVARDLGLHLIQFLLDAGFDVSFSEKLAKPRGEGHAFGFVHRRLMGSRIVPVVPLVVNTYYPPNQPRPRRCFQLGKMLARGVKELDEDIRVGIIASGGLSHFTIDEELDRRVLEACRTGDEKALASIPLAKLNSGNSEIRNWILVAGAAVGLRADWQEYVPLYRTPAATGCGMAFAAWGL
ncbi:MAG TPA: protocatechuate 3,4-dioxygenase [Burkholderiales bacterium]|nr:protocatechuate 3,4-dioxygenase [Burkholderiales bacterium]